MHKKLDNKKKYKNTIIGFYCYILAVIISLLFLVPFFLFRDYGNIQQFRFSMLLLFFGLTSYRIPMYMGTFLIYKDRNLFVEKSRKLLKRGIFILPIIFVLDIISWISLFQHMDYSFSMTTAYGLWEILSFPIFVLFIIVTIQYSYAVTRNWNIIYLGIFCIITSIILIPALILLLISYILVIFILNKKLEILEKKRKKPAEDIQDTNIDDSLEEEKKL